MYKIVLLSFFLFSLFILNSCTSTTEPTSLVEGYVILKVGLVKQYYNYNDSTYTNDKIYGKAIREDGQEVYIGAHSNSSPYIHQIDYSYYFIRDGYYYFTSLINYGDEKNPFHEQRIGKVYPKEGDSWYLDDNAPDSTKIQFIAHYIGQMTTPAGTFPNVYEYQFYDPEVKESYHVYYAEGVGSLGSISSRNKALLNYAKIDDKDYGEQIPAALLP